MTVPNNVNIWTHYLIDDFLDKGFTAVDLTAGNGHDTLFLASRAKHVYAFDIQKQAILNTRSRLMEYNLEEKCSLIQACHSKVGDFVKEEVDCIVMNLGYLPNGDKKIVTRLITTKLAIEKSLIILKEKGLFFITLYKSHPGAEEEVEGLEKVIGELDQRRFAVNRISFPNQKNSPPELFIIERKMS